MLRCSSLAYEIHYANLRQLVSLGRLIFNFRQIGSSARRGGPALIYSFGGLPIARLTASKGNFLFDATSLHSRFSSFVLSLASDPPFLPPPFLESAYITLSVTALISPHRHAQSSTMPDFLPLLLSSTSLITVAGDFCNFP